VKACDFRFPVAERCYGFVAHADVTEVVDVVLFGFGGVGQARAERERDDGRDERANSGKCRRGTHSSKRHEVSFQVAPFSRRKRPAQAIPWGGPPNKSPSLRHATCRAEPTLLAARARTGEQT